VNTELDPEEIALLRNIDEFNAKIASTGWNLREKDVKEDLSRIRLLHSSLTSVHFLHVKWNNAVVTDTRFNSVQFSQAKFSGATLEGVVFTDCSFEICSFQQATFTNCQFLNCRAEELNAKAASFEGCRFEKFNDTSGVFSSAVLRNCQFEHCHFENSSFQSAEIVSVPLRGSDLHNVVFGALKGTNLSFVDSKVEHTGFGESRYGSVVFERGTSKAVTFTGFKADSLRVQHCQRIEAFTLMDCAFQKITIADCPAVSELSIQRGRLTNVAIERCQIAYFKLQEANLSGESRFSQCQIAGLNTIKSTLVGLRIQNCLVAEYLILEGASFERLSLVGLEYAPQLQMRAAGVTYLGESARFELR
jgi:uncharacterized protein YjbI with pentapeptide repeats